MNKHQTGNSSPLTAIIDTNPQQRKTRLVLSGIGTSLEGVMDHDKMLVGTTSGPTVVATETFSFIPSAGTRTNTRSQATGRLEYSYVD